MDIDFRADQWHDARAFGVAVRGLLPLIDLVIGTEEEILAAASGPELHVAISDSQISSPEIRGDLGKCVEDILGRGPEAVVVKQGARGATVHDRDRQRHTADPFEVEVCNVLGAGDAFASGLIYGRLQGWDWTRCVQLGNATGALVVSRQGCANFMATHDEAMALIQAQGGGS